MERRDWDYRGRDTRSPCCGILFLSGILFGALSFKLILVRCLVGYLNMFLSYNGPMLSHYNKVEYAINF